MIDRINTIIEDLTNPEKSLGSVFLKVQVLAHQLRNDKLKDWVNNESNGYDKDIAIPIL